MTSKPSTPKASPDNTAGLESTEDLPLPHERDQAAGQVKPETDRVIEQAKRDLDAGQVDTDLRATPGLDAERRRDLVRNPR